MTESLTEDRRNPVTLTSWEALEIGGRVHLIGVQVGGHDRLPAGAWMITSPVRQINLTTKTAITASTGRRYVLRTRLEEPLPREAQDVIARAMKLWRIEGSRPVEVLIDAEIMRKMARVHLPGSAASEIAPSDDGPADDSSYGRKVAHDAPDE
jgi:hypothetical protein